MDSLDGINSLPSDVQTVVRDAYRQGSRFAFISLIPWCGLAAIASLFLSKIHDSDMAAPKTEGLAYGASEPKDVEEQGTPNLKEQHPNA